MVPEGYKLEDQIHTSRSAQVWQAKSPSGATVALKLAADLSYVERRFAREIEAMRLAAGPHVMPLLDSDDTNSWYAMPLAAGTLWEVDPAPPTSFEASLQVLEAITAALKPIHVTGQVHRDLKPQNILWLDNEAGARWVVADFGIVRNPAGFTTQQLTQIGRLTGTEGWAAPEQHDDAHKSTIEADVYAAAAIVSWMLTNKAPSPGRVKYPDNAPQLKAVLKRATNGDPTNRYPNLEELLEAVRNSAVASTPSLDSLVSAGDWPKVSSYVGQADRRNQVIAKLPKLEQAQVNAWFKADRPGLVSAFSDALDNLRADHNGLDMQTKVDPFLSWGVKVLRVLINNKKYDDAEHVATALFGATAGIHQFKPATDILNWIDGLDKQAQQAMETALHSSIDTWKFFKSRASGRWESKSKSDLVQRLQE